MEEQIARIYITNLGISVFLSMGLLVLTLKREYAYIPVVLTCSFFTLGEQVLIFGFHFTVLRLLLLATWFRIFIRGELFEIKLNLIDRMILLYVIASVITTVIREGTFAAFQYRMGYAYDSLGSYFFFRATLLNLEDIQRVVKFFGIMLIPLTVLMLIEKATGRNLFYIFGGVPQFSELRDGKLRAQGPFRHPILAGTLGATLAPLFLGMWLKQDRNRAIALMGFIATTMITILSASSGPVIAYLVGILSLLTWQFRHNMRIVRWGIACCIVGLHLIMKAPVWHLIGRFSEVFGGTGWYRAALIDAAIRHFNEWWLMGQAVTAHWAIGTGLVILPIDPTSVDITSQYILIGVNGGLLPLIFFIMLLGYAFGSVGRAWPRFDNEGPQWQLFIWSLGASLISHAASFTSVSYFDQLNFFFFLLLAMIATVFVPRQKAFGFSEEGEFHLAT